MKKYASKPKTLNRVRLVIIGSLLFGVAGSIAAVIQQREASADFQELCEIVEENRLAVRSIIEDSTSMKPELPADLDPAIRTIIMALADAYSSQGEERGKRWLEALDKPPSCAND